MTRSYSGWHRQRAFKLQTIKTTAMENTTEELITKQIGEYNRLEDEWNSQDKPYVFYAFNRDQFAQGVKDLERNGWKNEGEKLVNLGAGIFTTRRGYEKMKEEVEAHYLSIREACSPEAVYLYEYDNHESHYSMDGDLEPMRIVLRIFGEEALGTFRRKSACYTIKQIIEDKCY